MIVLLGAGPGCEEPVAAADLRDHIEGLCLEVCPLRIACVKDGWADGDVKACVRECADLRLYERGGEPSEALIEQLECLALLTCEELPAAVQGSERGRCAPEPVDFDSAAQREE